MTGDPRDWPTVDVFIPTYNEALSIVKLSIFAAQAIDWTRFALARVLLRSGQTQAARDLVDEQLRRHRSRPARPRPRQTATASMTYSAIPTCRTLR